MIKGMNCLMDSSGITHVSHAATTIITVTNSSLAWNVHGGSTFTQSYVRSEFANRTGSPNHPLVERLDPCSDVVCLPLMLRFLILYQFQ